MNMFARGGSDLVKEECCAEKLHNDMNFSSLILYKNSLKSKLSRIAVDLKRG